MTISAPSPAASLPFRTPRGRACSMLVREGTADYNNAFSCLNEDEYKLADVDLGNGVALDIGAHIGAVAIGLALDNRDATVIAVEALSVNCDIATRNVEENGVADRVTVLHQAATKAKVKSVPIEWDFTEGETGTQHRYIGNGHGIPRGDAKTEDVAAISLEKLVALAGGEVAFMKIDCETCEYTLLDSPAVKDVALIRGEFHSGIERIHEMLDATHVVAHIGGYETVGAFEAVRR